MSRIINKVALVKKFVYNILTAGSGKKISSFAVGCPRAGSIPSSSVDHRKRVVIENGSVY